MKRPFSFAHATRTLNRAPQATARVLFAPVLLLQARRTVRNTPRLDPAAGAEHGVTTGSAPAFRILVIGESTAAGVGADAHAEALPGFLAGALHAHLDRSVAWSVAGRNGATVRRVITDLVPALNGTTPDLVVVTVGINDLLRRRSLERWSADLAELITALRSRYRHAGVLVAGMPPVHRFPVLPQPLRMVMGSQARAMDRIMREIARDHGAFHVPMDEAMARDSRLFARDGFHPSPAGYRVWAHDLARAVSSSAACPAPLSRQAL